MPVVHNMYRVLKIARVAVQLIVLTVITWILMASPTLLVATLRGCVERWQLIPMSMLGSLTVVCVWLVVSLVFGRIYCSTVCPLGALQDIAARIPRLKRNHKSYRYKTGQPWFVRVAMLAILFMALCFGSLAASWAVMPFLQVSPYDSYSSMITSLAIPVAGWISGADAVPVAGRMVISAVINLVFLVSISAVRGRDVCNTLCPVGAALGSINTLALFQFDIDTDRCTHCRRCEDVCKSMCVDSDAGTVDATRCVTCFNCVAACPDDAIHYTTRRHRLSLPMLQSIKPPRPAISSNIGSKATIRYRANATRSAHLNSTANSTEQ